MQIYQQIHELPCIFKTPEAAAKKCSIKELLCICGWNLWTLLRFNFFTGIFRNFWPRVQNNCDEEQHFALHLSTKASLDGCFWNVFFFLVANICQSSTVSLLLHLRSTRNYIINKLAYYWLFSVAGHLEFRESLLTHSCGQVLTSIAFFKIFKTRFFL